MTAGERAARNERRDTLLGGTGFLLWWLRGAVETARPVDVENRFRELAPFRAEYTGAIDREYRMVRSNPPSITDAPDLKVPDRLYLAATEDRSNGWMWFDNFANAKKQADMHGGATEIWSCTPEEVFGCVEVVREEPAVSPDDEPIEVRWNLWALKPGRVWKMPRWRDPFAPIPKESTWEGRGVSAEEAESIVFSWITANPFKVSPFDRESEAFWLAHFDLIGQFSAVHTAFQRPVDGVGYQLMVEPASGLEAPDVLYRGSDESRSTRWSWTPDLEAAQLYAKTFGRENKVWCCTPRRIFGRVDFELPAIPGGSIWKSHTEWLLIPDQVWLASRPQDDPRKRGALPADFWN